MNPLWNKPCNDSDRQAEQTCQKRKDTNTRHSTPTIGSRLDTWPCLRMPGPAALGAMQRHLLTFRRLLLKCFSFALTYIRDHLLLEKKKKKKKKCNSLC